MSDLKKHRIILKKFIDVIDRIPFVKTTKSSKLFAVPYKTLLNLLCEYAPSQSNSNEQNMIRLIDTAFKTNNEQDIEKLRLDFVSHIQSKSTSERLMTVLSESIEMCDET